MTRLQSRIPSRRTPLAGRLPPGGDVELGLVDGAVALVGINPDEPQQIEPRLRKKLLGYERRKRGSPNDRELLRFRLAAEGLATEPARR